MQSFSRTHRSKRPSSLEDNQKNGDTDKLLDDDDTSKCCCHCKQQKLYQQQQNSNPALECKICLDTVKDPVVSMCGHLFCWPCLHQWLYTTDNSDSQNNITKTCPVCRSAISRDETIPIYGSDGVDPRDKLPPRPSGHRTEVPNQFPYGNVWAMGGPGAQIFGFGDGGFHMSFAIGSLSQYILAFLQEYSTTNDRGNDTAIFLMKFFAILGVLCICLTLYFC